MNVRLIAIFYALFLSLSVFANDQEKRESARTHFEEAARFLEKPVVDRARRLDNSDFVAAKAEYIKGINALLSIDETNRTPQDLRDLYEAIFRIAAKGPGRPPCCVLCLKNKKLIGSHVIPESILKHIGKTFTCSREPNQDRSAAKLKWPLYCKPGCEDLFCDLGEGKFAAQFLPFMKKLVKARQDGSHAMVSYTGKAGENHVHYNIASIVFRYMLTNGKNELKPFSDKLGPEVEEGFWRLFFLLREYLLDPVNHPAPYIELFLSADDIEKPALVNAVCTTIPSPGLPCFVTGHFEFNGFHFVVAESRDIRVHFPKFFDLPQNGFAQEIPLQPAHGALTLSILPFGVLKLPHIAMRARLVDAAAWRHLFYRKSPLTKTPAGAPLMASIPSHPLAEETITKPGPTHISRLPDDITVRQPWDLNVGLRFNSPEKYDVFFHDEYTDHELCALGQVWLCNNIASKQSPFMAILHWFFPKTQRAVSFGYHIDDDFFSESKVDEFTKTFKSQQDIIHTTMTQWLGLKPLRGTDHAGIEREAQSQATHKSILDALIGFWDKAFPKGPAEPRFYTGDIAGVEMRFVEREVPSDHDCAFHVMGITREHAIAQLLANVDDDDIRHMVGRDIRAAFIAGELPRAMRTAEISTLRRKLDVLTNLVERETAALRGLLPWQVRNVLTDLGDSVDFVSFLMAHEDLLPQAEDGRLARFLKLRAQLANLEIEIRNWTRSPKVFTEFVTQFLGVERQWLTYIPGKAGLFDAVAILNRLFVEIWVPVNANPERVILNHEAGNLGDRRIVAIHTNRLTHFNILEEAVHQREFEAPEMDLGIAAANRFGFGGKKSF